MLAGTVSFWVLHEIVCTKHLAIVVLRIINQIILSGLLFLSSLQISEVVNSMKDLISFERKTRLGPIRMLLHYCLKNITAVPKQLYLLRQSTCSVPAIRGGRGGGGGGCVVLLWKWLLTASLCHVTDSLVEFPSARKLQQQGLLTIHPNQPSLTTLINHFTQPPRQSMTYLQQQGHATRHPGGQVLVANGQQGVSQLQGHLHSQLQPGAGAPVHRDPNTSKIALTNHLQSQLRSQMDARNFGLAQAGQAYNNQMQPPGPLHLSGNSQAHSGNSTPSNGQLAGQLHAQITSQGPTQSQGQVPAQAHSGGAGGNAHSFPGNQVHLQLNHAQALSQLQGQSTMSQVPPAGMSAGHASPGIFNQLPQQTSFPTLPKQLTPQPAGQVRSQSHNSLNQNIVNGGQQSLPGTPQSEVSDLRSTA